MINIIQLAYIYIYIIGLSKFTKVVQIDYFFRILPGDYLSFFSLIYLYRFSQNYNNNNNNNNNNNKEI